MNYIKLPLYNVCMKYKCILYLELRLSFNISQGKKANINNQSKWKWGAVLKCRSGTVLLRFKYFRSNNINQNSPCYVSRIDSFQDTITVIGSGKAQLHMGNFNLFLRPVEHLYANNAIEGNLIEYMHSSSHFPSSLSRAHPSFHSRYLSLSSC